MGRWLLASLVVGAGLASGSFGGNSALGQERKDKDSEAGTSRSRDDKDDNSSKKIDQAIQTYESRVGQDLDQTRKEVERLRKALSDLVELRTAMAISLAELRAEQRVASSQAPAAGQYEGSGNAGQSASSPDQDRKHQNMAELNRELRQVQDLLQAQVQQVQSETDQSVAQLRTLRAQERQRQMQMQSDRERTKAAETKSKD